MGNCANASSLCSAGRGGSVKLPILQVRVGGRNLHGLIDTGCTDSMIRSDLVSSSGPSCSVLAFDGRVIQSRGRADVVIGVHEAEMSVNMIVVDEMLEGVDIVLGLDVIEGLGGMSMFEEQVEFGRKVCSIVKQVETESEGTNMMTIEDKDFVAKGERSCSFY